ncbi:MAG: sterol desaturase family protein [Chromatiales bacterium]|nr:sterol desaturase family protein [Chromatiales bacterium]
MTEWVLAHENPIRLGFFLGVFAVVALWEALAPCRQRGQSRLLRWSNNLALVALNTIVLRLTVPVLAVSMAVLADERGWGLLNLVDLPGWLALLAALLALDLAIYTQHVIFHQVPMLWRLHRLHHADTDYDVTTGLRFHPIEIVLSMLIKLAVVFLLGPPVVAVILFEVGLNAGAMFNHANASLPAWLDRPLRWLIVTPDMHRVHHSAIREETDSNYGFNLSWWDRLFGTYRQAPVAGNLGMTVGLDEFRDRRWQRLDRLLIQPFVDARSSIANR